MKESKLSYIALAISVGAAALAGVSGMLSVFPNSSKIDELTQQVSTLTEQNNRLNSLVGVAGENRARINELDVGITAVANVLNIDRAELAKAFTAVKAAQEADALAATAAQQQKDANGDLAVSPTAKQQRSDHGVPAEAKSQANPEAPELTGRDSHNAASMPTRSKQDSKTDAPKPATPLMGADNPFSAGLDNSNAGGEVSPALAVSPAKGEPLTIAQVDSVLGKRLSSNWYTPAGATEDLNTIIQLKMSRNGKVASVRIGTSSGNSAFDTSALSAVQSLGNIEEVRQLSDADFQKAYASRFIQFTPQMGR